MNTGSKAFQQSIIRAAALGAVALSVLACVGDGGEDAAIDSRASAFTLTDDLAGPPAQQLIPAQNFVAMSGIYSTPGIGTYPAWDGLSYVDSGDWVQYSGVRFGLGAAVARITTLMATPKSGEIVRFRADSLDGPILAELTTAETGTFYEDYVERTVDVTGERLTGIHDVFVEFIGGNGIGNFRWFRFDRLPSPSSYGITCATSSPDRCSTRLFANLFQEPRDPRVTMFYLSVNGQRMDPKPVNEVGGQLIDFPEPEAGVDVTVLMWTGDGQGYYSRPVCRHRAADAFVIDFPVCD